jgi:hypothetical protein
MLSPVCRLVYVLVRPLFFRPYRYFAISFFTCSWSKVYARVFLIGFIIVIAMQLKLSYAKQINCVVLSLATDQQGQLGLIHITLHVLCASSEELALLDPKG